jgi:alpha-glucosidase
VPNNWQASFGGKAWQWDASSGQYYLHAFLPQQPDINWRNPEARQAQLDVFRFWLERGVDGFRLDVFNAYFKDAAFRNNPPRLGLRGFDRQAHLYDINQPEMLDFLHELRALLDAFPARYAVGETYATPVDQAMKYIGDDRLHAAFTFDFLGSELYSPWSPSWLAKQISQMEKSFTQAGAWPTVVMGNHDQKRIASRITGSRLERGAGDQQALIAMTLLLTVRGTPFLYYGDEIGMRELNLKRAEILDPPGKKYWPFYKGRDGCRSPMQWSAADHAGFSTSKPWLKVHANYARRNVASQMDDPHSLLSHTRKLIALRRQVTALRQGKLSLHPQEDQQVLVYERSLEDPAHDKQRVLVCLNFSASERRVSLPDGMQNGQVLFSSTGRMELAASGCHLQLSPYEVILIKDIRAGG